VFYIVFTVHEISLFIPYLLISNIWNANVNESAKEFTSCMKWICISVEWNLQRKSTARTPCSRPTPTQHQRPATNPRSPGKDRCV